MVILSDDKGKRTIVIKYNNDIDININSGGEDYIAKAPTIICNDMKDAKYIQEKLNTYANKISQELLNKKED